MKIGSSSDINQTIIVEPVGGASTTVSACTALYVSNVYPCDVTGNTINLNANFNITGGTTASTITSLGPIYSGGTDLSSIFSGISNYYTTGTTLLGDTVFFNRNDVLSAYTLDLSSVNSADTYVTGVTFSNNLMTLTRNDATQLSVSINDFTGLTVNGTITANTINGGTILSGGTDLASIFAPIGSDTNTYTTGTTVIGGTIFFNRNDVLSAYSVDISSVNSGDTFVTGFTYGNNNTFRIGQNDGTVFSASVNTVTGLTVDGNITVTNNALIQGNVTILGTATTVDSETVLIKDNILTLNSNVTGATTPVLNSGFEVLRGSADTRSFLWNETNDEWTLDYNTRISGDSNTTGDIYSGGTNLLDLFAPAGSDTNYYTTGATLINDTIYFDRNDVLSGYSIDISSVNSADTYVTGVTFTSNTLTLTRNDNQIMSINISELTGLTVTGLLNVSGNSNFGSSILSGGTDLLNIFAKPADILWETSTGSNSIKIKSSTNTASGTNAVSVGDFNVAGDYAFASGLFTTANGFASHSEGSQTTANGNSAHAEGILTKAITIASHAEGSSTVASGSAAHAEGGTTTALGNYSHAEGSGTTASGLYSHAEGSKGIASGTSSHVEGSTNVAGGIASHAEGTNSTALGNSSHAEGISNITIGASSHAEGNLNTALGDNSHVEGQGNTSADIASHAEGYQTKALGSGSHSEGTSTTALTDDTHAGGRQSVASGETSFIHSFSSNAGGEFSAILGGTGNTLTSSAIGSVILGGTDITGTSANTVYGINFNASGNILSGSTNLLDIFQVGQPKLDTGVLYTPDTWVNNGDGTITLPQLNVVLYDNQYWTGETSEYVISSGTSGTDFAGLVDNSTNYLYVDYSAGTPVYVVTNTEPDYNRGDRAKFLTLYRAGNFLHILDWDHEGTGLSNKLLNRVYSTKYLERESGLTLSLSGGTNVVAISGGIVWNGIKRTTTQNVNSSADTFFNNYHVGGTYTYDTSGSTINNTHYDDGTGLVALGTNKYVVNWYYKGIETASHIYQVIGSAQYPNVSAAQLETPPNAPEIITSHTILVGRIIVQSGATGGVIESAFNTSFSPTQVAEHNDLSGLQGGATDEYYHLTGNEYVNNTYNNSGNTFTEDQTINAGLIVTGATIISGTTTLAGKVDMTTTTNGLLMPRLTTAEMNAIASPDTHLLVFNTDLNGIYRYNGSGWVALSTGYGIISVNDSSGQPTFYADMQTAVTAAGAGGVLTLHSNITQSSTITLPTGAGINFSINGNGYTITHTSNTGSEYQLFLAGGSSQTLYLNNLKIISNGTSSLIYTSSVFGYTPAITNVICSSDTYIYALNNNIKDFGTIRGGILEAVSGTVNNSCTVYDSTVITKSANGGFRNCHITVNSGGGIGGDLINCYVTGDCLLSDLITTSMATQIRGCIIDVTDSTGNFNAIQSSSATWNGLPNIQDTRVYYKGAGNVAVNLVYIANIKDVYIYAENGDALYAQNTTQTGGYNLENVVLETNSANDAAFSRLDSGDFRMKNVTATCLNASNTEPAMDIRVTSPRVLTMENCTANVNNASVKNVEIYGSGSAYIYNLTMSAIGTGLDMGTVTLLNTNTTDAYGNIKLG